MGGLDKDKKYFEEENFLLFGLDFKYHSMVLPFIDESPLNSSPKY